MYENVFVLLKNWFFDLNEKNPPDLDWWDFPQGLGWLLSWVRKQKAIKCWLIGQSLEENKVNIYPFVVWVVGPKQRLS